MADGSLDVLWKNVLDRWQEDAAHGAFLEYCQATGQLAQAAARYRGMTGDRERGAVAEKRLAGVAVVALTQLEATRTAPRRSSWRTSTTVLATVFCLWTVAALGYLVFSRLGR